MKPFLLIYMSTVTMLPVTKIMQNILDRACLAGCRDVSMKKSTLVKISRLRACGLVEWLKIKEKSVTTPLVTPGQTGNTEGGGDE